MDRNKITRVAEIIRRTPFPGAPTSRSAPACWTIPSGETTAFFAYFTVLNILGLCFIGWHEHLTNQTQGILNIIRMVIANAGSVTVGSAGIAT